MLRFLHISITELDNLTKRLEEQAYEVIELTRQLRHTKLVIENQQGVIEELLSKCNALEGLTKLNQGQSNARQSQPEPQSPGERIPGEEDLTKAKRTRYCH